MGRLAPVANSFQCRFDMGEFTATLDREGQPPRMFEARLVRRISGVFSVGSGCLVFVERDEEPAAVAGRLVNAITRLAPVAIDDTTLDDFREVATHWLAFNFRPTLD